MITIINLTENALKQVPAFKMEYERLIAIDEIDKESGEHIIFGYAFAPILVDAINNGNKKVYENMLDFAEQMAKSDDIRVKEVCDYAITEVLNDNFTENELEKILGEEMQKSLAAVKQYMY